ncbi:MAG: hypothetical protein J1E00_07425 [Oscillospiraceae bacterium]|nr:hypothetical protein [Oscillospiraceae bacterium]
MLTFSDLRPFYPFDPPEALASLPLRASDASRPLLTEEELAAVAEATATHQQDGGAWFAPCMAFLRELLASLLAEPARNMAAILLRRYLIEEHQPWEVHLYAPSLLELPGYEPGAVDLLFVTAALGYTLTVRKPPYDLNAENIGAYIGYTRAYCDAHGGKWGINERSWNLLGAGGCMFVFHTLKFQPERFAPDFLVLKNGKSSKDGSPFVTLLRHGFGIAPDGSLTRDEARSSAHAAPLRETEEAYIAHEILPDGRVWPEARTFRKSEWTVALDENSMMLGLHIPPRLPYTVEDHRRSMQEAYAFYAPFLKNVGEIKGFVCYSWLYSAQNKHILPPESNILEIQRHVHLCPMLTELDESLMFLRPGSSLQQRLADFRAAGNAYHVGYMYVPLEEAETFGSFKHEI